MTPSPPRDRLRELLDALLADDDGGLDAAADRASSSPFHFSRQLSSATGESPMAIRRRVLLERAAWQLAEGSSVTDAAFVAGYESVDGFSRAFHRAFGFAPSGVRTGLPTWLPSPNGIHFHPPVNLWLASRQDRPGGLDDAPGGTGAGGVGDLVGLLVRHDVDDAALLLARGATLDDADWRRQVAPDEVPMSWVGPSPSVAVALEQMLWNKEVWVAAVRGEDLPTRGGDSADELQARQAAAGPRWIATVGDIAARGAWSDRFVDALCEPPESFVLSAVVAHVIEYAAHQRQLVRTMLRRLGHDVDDGDPINWLHDQYGADDARTDTDPRPDIDTEEQS